MKGFIVKPVFWFVSAAFFAVMTILVVTGVLNHGQTLKSRVVATIAWSAAAAMNLLIGIEQCRTKPKL